MINTGSDKRPQWLNEHEVSAITGRAVQTLRNDRFNRKGIHYCKVGGRVLYKLSDVESYMDSCRVTFS